MPEANPGRLPQISIHTLNPLIARIKQVKTASGFFSMRL